jgi:hypothetical protein
LAECEKGVGGMKGGGERSNIPNYSQQWFKESIIHTYTVQWRRENLKGHSSQAQLRKHWKEQTMLMSCLGWVAS